MMANSKILVDTNLPAGNMPLMGWMLTRCSSVKTFGIGKRIGLERDLTQLPEIEPTNNRSEVALRNMVLLRKIIFGRCSERGTKNVSLSTTTIKYKNY